MDVCFQVIKGQALFHAAVPTCGMTGNPCQLHALWFQAPDRGKSAGTLAAAFNTAISQDSLGAHEVAQYKQVTVILCNKVSSAPIAILDVAGFACMINTSKGTVQRSQVMIIQHT